MKKAFRLHSYVCLVLLLLGSSCGERDTKLTVEGGNPPEFHLSGSGSLVYLRIHGPKVRPAEDETAYIVWEIVPSGGWKNARGMEKIGTIIYGIVPAGYTQVYPEEGKTAPQIIEGEQYHVWAESAGANSASKEFAITKNKVVELSIK